MEVVLITGAAGFVASHLVDRYLTDGASIIGVDNFVTGNPGNIAHARASSSFHFIEADVTTEWDRIRDGIRASGLRPTKVLHLASPASPIDYARLPMETLAVNSVGTITTLELAREYCAAFLYASTSETYGDPLEHPQTESYWGNVNPVGPRSCYDEAKRFGEAAVTAFQRVHEIDARIIRIFNTYGPRMRVADGRVVPQFISQALAARPLTVYGDGKQTRSFCYVSDLVDGIARAAASPAVRGLVTNLGNPNETTIYDFAATVARIVGVELRVETQALPQDDPLRRQPDITRARELLNWEPKVSLENGLRETIAYFRANAHEPSDRSAL